MDQKFFKNSLKVTKAMRDAKLSELTNQTLVDYHRKCHMLYAGNIKNHPINKRFINSIVVLHGRIVNEMVRRNMQHNTPLRKI